MPEAKIVAPGLDASSGLPAARRRCRIFVSYAHQDAKWDEVEKREYGLLSRFELELKSLLADVRDIGHALSLADVFFDIRTLPRAPEWAPAIQAALAECELFILLLSPDSLASDYCINDELNVALQRQPAPKVTTILLRPLKKNWFRKRVTGGELGRLHSGGIPKQAGNALAITSSSWPNRDEAWAAMSNDLGSLIAETFAPLSAHAYTLVHVQPVAQLASQPVLDQPAAPYLCNQTDIVRPFFEALDLWMQKHQRPALAVVLQGCTDDGLNGFADRLRLREMRSRLVRLGAAPGVARKRMKWPKSLVTTERFPGITVTRSLFMAIDPSLEAQLWQCLTLVDAAECLRQHLARQASVEQVLASLPDRSDHTLATLNWLLALIQSCQPSEHELCRLQLFLMDESAEDQRDAFKPFDWASKLNATAHAEVVVLPPLMPIVEADLQEWFDEHGIERLFSWPGFLQWFRAQSPPAPKPAQWWQRLTGTATRAQRTPAATSGLRMERFARAYLDHVGPRTLLSTTPPILTS